MPSDLLGSPKFLSAAQLHRLLTEHLTQQQLGLYWESSAIERDAERQPVLGWLCRLAKANPIAPQKEELQAYDAAFERAAEVLRAGGFAGNLPRRGHYQGWHAAAVQGGIVKILERARAGSAHGTHQPVGLVLQPHRTRRRHGAAAAARPVQAHGAEHGPGAAGAGSEAGSAA